MQANPPTGTNGCVYYDGTCSFCIGWARRLQHLLASRGFAIAPLQSRPENPATQLTEMRVTFADGCELGGADSMVALARYYWWAWPIFALAHIPGAMPLLRASYRRLAANRHCFGVRCELNDHLPGHHRHVAFLELP